MKRIHTLSLAISLIVLFPCLSSARYFDPQTGRYLTPDPIGLNGGVNLYSYVQNDPVNFTDPWGLLKRDSSGNIISTNVGTPIAVTHPSGASAAVQPVKLYANDGTQIDAFQFQSGHPGMKTDCHGVTFGDAKYWINNDQVDALLKGDGYNPTAAPKNGDVLVYRDPHGNVVHSVTVTGVSSSGTVTGVTGLGGIQTQQSTTTPSAGWSGTATRHYYKP